VSRDQLAARFRSRLTAGLVHPAGARKQRRAAAALDQHGVEAVVLQQQCRGEADQTSPDHEHRRVVTSHGIPPRSYVPHRPAGAEETRDARASPTRRCGCSPDAMTALVVPRQVLAVHPLALRMVERWTTQGAPPQDVRARVLALIDRAVDLIEQGLPNDSSSADTS
jgi:hypothetical protein